MEVIEIKVAAIYWSLTGNTEKVAFAIKEALECSGLDYIFKRTEEAEDLDFFEYDLLCISFPVMYRWLPAKPMDKYLQAKYKAYYSQGLVKTGSPKLPGKNVLIVCTFSGPHTGVNEAIPSCKWVGQLFEHLGFTVVDEWYIVGEFHGNEEWSTKGKMGDIRGRPNEEDLRKVKQDMIALLKGI